MLFSLRVYVHAERLGWLFAQDGDSHTGAWPPLGHGEREGPAGDKLSAAADDAGYGGRVRKERSDWSPPCGSPHPAQLVIG